MQDLIHFLEPLHFIDVYNRNDYNNNQIGKKISIFPHDDFSPELTDIFIVGCGENRDNSQNTNWSNSPDAIRRALYKMYDWHPEIKVADLGNILEGKTANDTKAALRAVLEYIHSIGKIAIVLGSSQELTLQQYAPFQKNNELIEVAAIDMLMDIEEAETINERSYLMHLLTDQPNYIKHFSLIGFQSYYTNPTLLQTLDRLRFDCFRLGRVRANIEEMEASLRSCELVTVDLNVLRASEAPYMKQASPNGLFNDELCQLVRYAGMSEKIKSIGIYGFNEEYDETELGAAQIAQMIWYFIDGYRVKLAEYPLTALEEFEEYNVSMSNTASTFLKSRRTGRWWMKLPDQTFIPASYNDYLIAAANEYPERWLRAQERI